MTTSVANAKAWARLALRSLPQEPLVALLRTFGGPQAILGATTAALQQVVPETVVTRVTAADDPIILANISAWLDEPGHEVLAWDDPDYPPALLELGHAPTALYFMGSREWLARPALAIVGSRNASPQGRANARAFARTLANAGLTIVSGLAVGIDAAAHEGALASDGGTIAVVGTGLDRVYPARHRDLARAIATRGALLSEFAPGTPPLPHHFPRRNRLISGLARGVLVVEAALPSGSLITARLAGEQGREVFAIPGSIHSPLSRGCHRLIREGAKLVDSAQDVLEELGMAPLTVQSTATRPGARASALLVALGDDPVDVDTLVGRTGSDAPTVIAELALLELAGMASALPGGRWQRLH